MKHIATIHKTTEDEATLSYYLYTVRTKEGAYKRTDLLQYSSYAPTLPTIVRRDFAGDELDAMNLICDLHPSCSVVYTGERKPSSAFAKHLS